MFGNPMQSPYVREVSIEPKVVGQPFRLYPGSIPEVQTAVTPFYKPLPIGAGPDGLGAGPDGLGDFASTPGGGLVIGLVFVGVIGLVGYLAYQKSKVYERIAEKEGTRGLLALEAGEAGIGLLSAAGHRSMRSNKKKRRKAKRCVCEV